MTTSACLLHGLVLLPSGISSKMTAILDLTTIIDMLVASFYRFAVLPIFCSSSLPNCHEPLTFDTLPSKPLLGYVTALLSPLIALLVVGEVEDCSMVDRIMLGYHNISYIINASIYLVKGEGSALCLVFCSTLAALVSVIPVYVP